MMITNQIFKAMAYRLWRALLCQGYLCASVTSDCPFRCLLAWEWEIPACSILQLPPRWVHSPWGWEFSPMLAKPTTAVWLCKDSLMLAVMCSRLLETGRKSQFYSSAFLLSHMTLKSSKHSSGFWHDLSSMYIAQKAWKDIWTCLEQQAFQAK